MIGISSTGGDGTGNDDNVTDDNVTGVDDDHNQTHDNHPPHIDAEVYFTDHMSNAELCVQ